MTGPIHIALTFDDGFWAPAYAAARSICLTTHRKSDLVFHLFHFGLRQDHAEILQSLRDYGVQIIFYELNDDRDIAPLRRGLPEVTAKRLHPIVYVRLFLHHFLPDAVDRVLYLDCDILVRAPIEDLYDTQLDDCILAAAKQPDRMLAVGGRDLEEKALFDLADPYFNAGVLLIDLKRFARANAVEKTLAGLSPDQLAVLYYDQDLINYAFKTEILELDPLWNLQSPEPAHEPFDPKIVHYTGSIKPWALRPRVAFASAYRHTMKNRNFYKFFRERVARRFGRSR